MSIELYNKLNSLFLWPFLILVVIVFVIYPPLSKYYVYIPLLKRYKSVFKLNNKNIIDWGRSKEIREDNFYIPTIVTLNLGLWLLYKTKFCYKNFKFRISIDYDAKLAKNSEIYVAISLAIFFQAMVVIGVPYGVLIFLEKFITY